MRHREFPFSGEFGPHDQEAYLEVQRRRSQDVQRSRIEYQQLYDGSISLEAFRANLEARGLCLSSLYDGLAENDVAATARHGLIVIGGNMLGLVRFHRANSGSVQAYVAKLLDFLKGRGLTLSDLGATPEEVEFIQTLS